MNHWQLKNFFIIACFFLLTACGFHLRGNYQLPAELQKIYVASSTPNDPFVFALKRALTNNKIRVVEQATQANYMLHINQITKNSTLQASSTTGQVNSYVLTLTIGFDLVDAHGNIILPSQQVQGSQLYTLSSSTVVANTAQEQSLLVETYRDAINQIMARLSANNTKKNIVQYQPHHETLTDHEN